MRSGAQDVENDYSAPLAPKCIQWKDFLPSPNSIFSCQDIREGQSQKTLAYTQALQYWVEKSNLPTPSQLCLLAECVLELRWAMEPYVNFSHDAILEGATTQERSLEGQTRATIPRKTQPAPAYVPAKEAAPTGELALVQVFTKEAVPIEEPTDEMDPMEEPTEEPMATKAPSSEPVGESDIRPAWHEDKGKGEVPHSDYPGWMEVLHPAQLATSAREIPLPPGKLR